MASGEPPPSPPPRHAPVVGHVGCMVPNSIFCGQFHNNSRPVSLGCISMTDISTELRVSLVHGSRNASHTTMLQIDPNVPRRHTKNQKVLKKPYKLQIKISKHGANEDNDDNIDALFVTSEQFLIKDTTRNTHLYKLLSRDQCSTLDTTAQCFIHIELRYERVLTSETTDDFLLLSAGQPLHVHDILCASTATLMHACKLGSHDCASYREYDQLIIVLV